MAEDRDRRGLKVGDRVAIEGVITSISPGEDLENVMVRLREPVWPTSLVKWISLNGRQVMSRQPIVPDPRDRIGMGY